jgi:pyridoxamine 5'-phosphate oxidase
MEAKNFVLSTLHPVETPATSPDGPQSTPRCRTVVYRGLWAQLPVNPKNTAKLNPSIYESDLPTITTDDRMEKVPELFQTATTGGSSEPPQSRRTGPVEAVFWMPEVMTQWRIRGSAVVVGPDIDSEGGGSARKALEARMRKTDDAGSSDQWSWGRELTAHFGNLSPMMRGSFRNPPPGTPVDEKPAAGYGLGQKVEDVEDEVARRHFRVVVIVPEEVDQVDLSDPARGRRWNYKFVDADSGGSWKVTELWP